MPVSQFSVFKISGFIIYRFEIFCFRIFIFRNFLFPNLYFSQITVSQSTVSQVTDYPRDACIVKSRDFQLFDRLQNVCSVELCGVMIALILNFSFAMTIVALFRNCPGVIATTSDTSSGCMSISELLQW